MDDSTQALVKRLEKLYPFVCVKGEDNICAINIMFFTTAILAGCNDTGYEERWCYKTPVEAFQALADWSGEGEPSGWHRHPTSGRRRPDGDSGQEFVRW